MSTKFVVCGRGLPPDPAWKVAGYFDLLLITGGDHPTDPRAEVGHEFLLRCGELRRPGHGVLTDWRIELLFHSVDVNVKYQVVERWPAYINYTQRHARVETRLFAPVLTRPFGRYATSVTGNPAFAPNVEHPDFDHAQMTAYAREVKGKSRMPPGALVDWLREQLPTVNALFDEPPLPACLRDSRLEK